MNIRGIFFDLGGTLFDYDSNRKRTRRALMSALNSLSAGVPLVPEAIGRAYTQANQEIVQRYAKLDYYLHADMFRDTFRRATELLGLGFDEATYETYRQAQHEDIVEGLSLKHDCEETLAALKEAGHYLSIVSNIDEDMLQPLVEREQLNRFLHHWTSSEAAQSCKPHARFFELSLEKSGLQPAEVLFVGDSPEHDINGASRLGMRTALIRNGDKEPPLQSGVATAEPDHMIDNLAELKVLV